METWSASAVRPCRMQPNEASGGCATTPRRRAESHHRSERVYHMATMAALFREDTHQTPVQIRYHDGQVTLTCGHGHHVSTMPQDDYETTWYKVQYVVCVGHTAQQVGWSRPR